MWFKLAGADFSKNNLGTMSSISSSYLIDYTGLTGMSGTPSSVSYAGSDAGTSKSVSVTVTVTSGYTFKTGSTISASGGATGTVFTANKDYVGGNTFTFNMSVNANTKLSGAAAATGGSSSGGGGSNTPTNYTFTITPDPDDATVTLSATGYSTVSGTGSKSITVANGTIVNWSVSASGYTTREGSWTISGGNKTENIALTASGGSGTVIGVNKLNPNDPDINRTQYLDATHNWKTQANYGESGYISCSAGDIIRAGRFESGVWKPNKSVAAHFYDADKKKIATLGASSAVNGSTTDFAYTAPTDKTNIAYVRMAIRIDFVPNGFMITINEASAPTEFIPYTETSGGNSGSGDSGNTPVVGVNKFNKNDPGIIKTQSLTSDGNLGTLTANYGVTHYIACEPGDKIRVGNYREGKWTAVKNVSACFYDENKEYVSGVSSATQPGDGDNYYTAPEGAAYIRASFKLDYIDATMATVGEDAPPTKFVAYGE